MNTHQLVRAGWTVGPLASVSVGRKWKGKGYFFFFKQKTAYEILTCDWSSDVCSSDLGRCRIEIWSVKKAGAAATRTGQYEKRGAAAMRNGDRKSVV